MTTNTKERRPIVEARAAAAEVVALVQPFVTRVEIAGSILRRSATVKDIEIVCIPRMLTQRVEPVAIQADLFGSTREPEGLLREYDSLDRALKSAAGGPPYTNTHCDTFKARRKVDGTLSSMGPKNKHLIHVPSGIRLDVFTTDAANWGMAMFVRTGPAEWNIRAMSRFQALGMKGHAYGGVTDFDGGEIECRDEATVFQLLQWRYTPPEGRR